MLRQRKPRHTCCSQQPPRTLCTTAPRTRGDRAWAHSIQALLKSAAPCLRSRYRRRWAKPDPAELRSDLVHCWLGDAILVAHDVASRDSPPSRQAPASTEQWRAPPLNPTTTRLESGVCESMRASDAVNPKLLARQIQALYEESPTNRCAPCTQRPRNAVTGSGAMGSMMPAKHSDCCERYQPRRGRSCIRTLNLNLRGNTKHSNSHV